MLTWLSSPVPGMTAGNQSSAHFYPNRASVVNQGKRSLWWQMHISTRASMREPCGHQPGRHRWGC